VKKSLTVFQCEPLSARLTVKSCADRHVRAAACTPSQRGGWIPAQWAKFVHPCRGCSVGVDHAALLGVSAPARPGPPPPTWVPRTPQTTPEVLKPLEDPEEAPEPPRGAARRRMWKCQKCESAYHPTSNRQKHCPSCSKARRFRKLRSHQLYICEGCNCIFKPESSTRLDLRTHCAVCQEDRERKRKREWSREALKKVCRECLQVELPDHRASLCVECRPKVRARQLAEGCRRWRERKRVAEQKSAWLQGDLHIPQ